MRAPFILYFASAKYRLTVTPSNEIKDTSLPPSLPSLPLSLSFSRSRGRESRVRLQGSSCHLAYYSTPLSSLADELPGAFLFTRATSCSPRTLFFFLVPPSPSVHGPLPPPPAPSWFFRSFFLSFPLFLLLHPGTRSRGIMQHITEKSKQARRNSPGSDCPDSRVAPLSLQRPTSLARITLGPFSR